MADDSRVVYRELAPPAALAPFVRALWDFAAAPTQPPGSFVLPPDGGLSLAVVAEARPTLRLVGPRLRPLTVPVYPGAQIRGVRFRPHAAGALLALAPADWVDRLDTAAGVEGALAELVAGAASVDAAREAVLAELAGRAADAPAPDPAVGAAIDAVEAAGGRCTVGHMAERAAVGVRTLQRRFRRATGLSPKPYARLRRFLLAAGNVLRADPHAWGRVAIEHGYADQAHFVRECVAMTGMTPSAFAERSLSIEHIGVAP